MQAAVITRFGGPDVLEIRQVAMPSATGPDVLVRVFASALNRADLLQRRGKYPAPPGCPSEIPGLEFAGQVEAVGPEVQLWKPGQRVMGLTGGGAQAQYLTAHERTLIEVPENLSWIQAAAIPEAFITAHDALWKQAALRPGERVLIHAVGSGVGLAAVQFACAINAVPCGTSRTQDKLDRAKEFGLEQGFVVSRVPTDEQAKGWARFGAFDVVADLVGGAYTSVSPQAMALRGRLILIGTMAGSKTELELGPMLYKRLHVIGTSLRARPLEEKIAATRAFAAEAMPLFARGMLRPVVDSEYSLDQIRAAHQKLESNETFGKIVIRIADH